MKPVINKASSIKIILILFSSILFFGITTLPENINTSERMRMIFQDINPLRYSNRGNRMEGINPPRDVGGAYLELESALILPQDSSAIAINDSVHIKFFISNQDSLAYLVEVKERRTNYMLKPHSNDIQNGRFSWSANEVIIPLVKRTSIRIQYSDLLPLAKRKDSIGDNMYVQPVALAPARMPLALKGYHFIFRANTKVTIDYKLSAMTEKANSRLIKKGKLTKKANNSFLIEWDGNMAAGSAPEGQYLLALTGEAQKGPEYEPVKLLCYFYHKPVF